MRVALVLFLKHSWWNTTSSKWNWMTFATLGSRTACRTAKCSWRWTSVWCLWTWATIRILKRGKYLPIYSASASKSASGSQADKDQEIPYNARCWRSPLVCSSRLRLELLLFSQSLCSLHLLRLSVSSQPAPTQWVLKAHLQRKDEDDRNKQKGIRKRSQKG